MNTTTQRIILAILTAIVLIQSIVLTVSIHRNLTPSPPCNCPKFERVGEYMDDLFEPEYEVELVSQDIVIVRNVGTDEQWEVKPTELNEFFIQDNQ